MSEEKTRTGVQTTCIVCGAVFLSASGKKLYCSSRCWYRRNRDRHVPRVTKTCPVCGKTFVGTPGRKAYCSRHCRYMASRAANVAYSSLYNVSVREKLETDCEAYADFRARARRNNRRNYEKTHPGCKPYRPTESRRIPDWAVKGQAILDRRSVFLPGNMSDDKVVAAIDHFWQQNTDDAREHPRVKTVFRGR